MSSEDDEDDGMDTNRNTIGIMLNNYFEINQPALSVIKNFKYTINTGIPETKNPKMLPIKKFSTSAFHIKNRIGKNQGQNLNVELLAHEITSFNSDVGPKKIKSPDVLKAPMFALHSHMRSNEVTKYRENLKELWAQLKSNEFLSSNSPGEDIENNSNISEIDHKQSMSNIENNQNFGTSIHKRADTFSNIKIVKNDTFKITIDNNANAEKIIEKNNIEIKKNDDKILENNGGVDNCSQNRCEKVLGNSGLAKSHKRMSFSMGKSVGRDADNVDQVKDVKIIHSIEKFENNCKTSGIKEIWRKKKTQTDYSLAVRNLFNDIANPDNSVLRYSSCQNSRERAHGRYS